jgi:hypothetical protein
VTVRKTTRTPLLVELLLAVLVTGATAQESGPQVTITTSAPAADTTSSEPSAVMTQEAAPGLPSTSRIARPAGEAALFHVRFNPPQALPMTVHESDSEELKVVMPSGELRSKLTTSTVSSRVAYEKTPSGWRRTEVVDIARRSFEGLELDDPIIAAAIGVQLVMNLDSKGVFNGLADGPKYRDDLLARLANTTAKEEATRLLTMDHLEAQARAGWEKKVGRFLKEPLQIGVPKFEQVIEELPDVGSLDYFRCYLATGIETGADGRPRVAVEILSFGVTLIDGVIEGVPEELTDEFAAWAEGRELHFSDEKLSVGGEGDLLLELSGVGTTDYSLTESFSIEPAAIKTLEGTIEANQVYLGRTTELSCR